MLPVSLHAKSSDHDKTAAHLLFVSRSRQLDLGGKERKARQGYRQEQLLVRPSVSSPKVLIATDSLIESSYMQNTDWRSRVDSPRTRDSLSPNMLVTEVVSRCMKLSSRIMKAQTMARLGFPIWLKNNTACPIGTILVSGLPQAEDHQVRCGRRSGALVYNE